MKKPVVLAFLVAASGAIAEDAVEGGRLYAAHCAVCHGPSAMGDGPMVPVLTIAPPDLTTLAERYGGEFPTEYTVQRIDGDESLISHGGPMPVFADILDGPSGVLLSEAGTDIVTSTAIVDIVTWLKSVQR